LNLNLSSGARHYTLDAYQFGNPECNYIYGHVVDKALTDELRSCFKITQVSARQGKNRRESTVWSK
jgi:hypothetical protein